MSSPIAIRRSSASSDLTASSSSPTSALYVPVHKRGASTSSSPSNSSMDSFTATVTTQHTCTYSIDYLLSLRPFAAEGIKEKMLAACPEAVMNGRVRKRFNPVQKPTESVASETTPQTTAAAATRCPTTRRTRFSGRAPERRRQALGLHHDSWRGMRNSAGSLSVVAM